jgi:molybdate transport system substrate-binding protein
VQSVWGRWLPVWLIATLSLPGCGGSGDQQILVFAASSLTDVFDRLERDFEAEHPGVDVVLNYGGSSLLAGQIEQGAPADIFAAADLTTMQRVLEVGASDAAPVVFARNRMAIAVEEGNPMGITGLDGLTADGLIVVLADQQVPAGAYATAMLQRAGIELTPASYESNVRAVAAKVALGEADAGIVYRTDIVADDDQLDEVVIPDEQNITADYPIEVLRGGALAQTFADFVLGAAGRTALSDAGFEVP